MIFSFRGVVRNKVLSPVPVLNPNIVLFGDMGAPQQDLIFLPCDNHSAIQIAHNDVFHDRTKHIENDCHFVRHHLLSNTVLLLRSISTTEQPTNIFTKVLSPNRFHQLLTKLKLTVTLPS